MDRSRREMTLFRSDLNKAKKKRRELHSLRCDLAYKLHVGYSQCLHCNADTCLDFQPGVKLHAIWHCYTALSGLQTLGLHGELLKLRHVA